MPQKSADIKNLKTGKIFFILSLCILLFWVLVQVVDIYRFAVIGAVFEMLWLPMLSMLFVLPVLSLILWAKERFKIRSLYLSSIVIFIITILLMIFFN